MTEQIIKGILIFIVFYIGFVTDEDMQKVNHFFLNLFRRKRKV